MCILLSTSIFAQKKLIQFTGVVVTGDSLMPVPYVSIMIKNTYHGTVSDFYGFFSFVCAEGDTVIFQSIGFKKSEFVIPTQLPDEKYSIIQILSNDTITLPEVSVYPWPSKEEFKEAFLNLSLPANDMDRAASNLSRQDLREFYAVAPMDGLTNYKYQMQMQQTKLYYAGQFPPINLLNPIAWAQFMQAWRSGKFKKK